jgi:hypothetical protein
MSVLPFIPHNGHKGCDTPVFINNATSKLSGMLDGFSTGRELDDGTIPRESMLAGVLIVEKMVVTASDHQSLASLNLSKKEI